MTITLDPIAVGIGSFAVRWYGLLALTGLAVGVWHTVRLAVSAGLKSRTVLDTAALALPVGFVCARITGVLSEWDYYFTEPRRILDLGLHGLSLWGGIVGSGLALAWALRDEPHIRLEIAAAASSGLALGLVIASIGAFIDGSGQGTRTALPWGTSYTNPLSSTPDFGVARHPVQAYQGLIALTLWVLLAGMRRTGVPAGGRLWGFLLLLGMTRVALAAVHLSPPFLLGMQLDQLLALLVMAFAALQLVRPATRALTPRTARIRASHQR